MPDAPTVLPADGHALGAPLSERRAASLVARLPLAPGRHVLQLGCGRGELLMRVVESHPAATGTGVDRRRAELDAARREASRRRLSERVELVEADPVTFDDRGDVVVCLGTAGAWGGATRALRALRERVEPGGRLLFGDHFWERPPGAEARRAFGELPTLSGLVHVAEAAGFRVELAEPSTREEWEAFEASHRVPAEQAVSLDGRQSAGRRRAYDGAHSGGLGFATLVLAR